MIGSRRLLPIHRDGDDNCVTARLDASRRKVYQLIESGRLRSVRLDGRRLVDERDLNEFIDSLK